MTKPCSRDKRRYHSAQPVSINLLLMIIRSAAAVIRNSYNQLYESISHVQKLVIVCAWLLAGISFKCQLDRPVESGTEAQGI